MENCAWVKDAFFAFLSALMGTTLGIVWANWKLKREKESQMRVMRSNLINAFKFNVDRIRQCSDFLKREPQIIPNFRLDTATVNHILFMGRDLFRDENMFNRFNWQRYQLEHINAKLDYIQLYISTYKGSNDLLVQQGLSSLTDHLSLTEREIKELLEEFERNTN